MVFFNIMDFPFNEIAQFTPILELSNGLQNLKPEALG